MKNANFKALGTTGLRRYGPYIYEEFLPELLWPRANRVYQEMADNDPVIGSILYLAEMLIRGATWEAKPFDDTPIAREQAEFLKSCMDDMEMSWPNVISEILSMLTYGFSFHEIIYKIRRGPNERKAKYRSNHTDCKIGWRAIPIRSQASIEEWVYNDENELVAVVQVAEPDNQKVVIPIEKGLLFRTKISRENPEGKSLLRNAYRPWFFKKHFEEIEGIGIERDLAGFPVLTAPENLDLWNEEDEVMVRLKANAEKLVASVRRDSEEGMLLPFGWDLKLLSSTSSRQINIGETIDRYDNRIAITMLSDIILLGTKTGSFALADTKQSMLAASLQAHVNNIADVFNKEAVTKLFKLNNGNLEKLPKIVPSQIQTPSLKELALVLRAMGLNIAGDYKLHNYFRYILGMPEISEKDFKKIYEVQGADAHNKGDDGGDDPNKTRDPGTRDLEQNDMNYTGDGEM